MTLELLTPESPRSVVSEEEFGDQVPEGEIPISIADSHLSFIVNALQCGISALHDVHALWSLGQEGVLSSGRNEGTDYDYITFHIHRLHTTVRKLLYKLRTYLYMKRMVRNPEFGNN